MEGKQEFSANQSHLTADDAVDISGNGSAFIQKSTLKGGNATNVESAMVGMNEATLSSPQGYVNIIAADNGRIENSTLTSEQSIKVENVSLVGNRRRSRHNRDIIEQLVR